MTEPIAKPRVRTRDRVGPSPADSLIKTPALPGSDLRRRVSRLLLLRTIVVSVVLGLSLWVLVLDEQRVRAAVWLQSLIIAATYLTSIVFGVLLRTGMSAKKIARPMLAADLGITSILVYISGGAQSPYAFLYALSIIAAGALSYRRGAVAVTVASILSLVVVALASWARVIDLPVLGRLHPWEQSGADLARTLGIQAAALIGVGALAFIFGDQLEKGAETLATTRKAAADLLTLHKDIVRSLASGLITIAPDGTVLTANTAAADILRSSQTRMVGLPIEDVMPGLLALLANKGELRRADLALPELVVGVTVSPLRDDADRVIGSVINFTDLTELRRLEQQFRRAERLVAIGQIAAGVAHEIRNPLASISGSIELLRQSPQASDDDKTLMNIVNREIKRLNDLITDLLDYASPRPKEAVDFDLGVLVRETLQVARGEQAFADVEMSSHTDEPLSLHADPSKLRQVVWNLLRNAADAAGAGGKHVRVEVRGFLDVATITVEDDGPGIAKEKLQRIFDPFFTTKKQGTGLGLATCHAVVSEHGGRIDVDSDLGKGTKMVVTLPRTPVA